mgnify:CR=1 FL=1
MYHIFKITKVFLITFFILVTVFIADISSIATAQEKRDIQENQGEYSLLIRKREFKVYLLNKNSVEFSWDCALGKSEGQKEREGDMRTPVGKFVVDEIVDASSWTHDFKDGKGEIDGAYGPWFISLDTSKLSNDQWGGIGIHGTHDNSSIGKLASEGCIRLKNSDVEKLKPYTYVGMKVVIQE